MNSFLDDLTLEQLDGDSRELAEVIGMDAFKKLVEVYGGSGSLYIPSFATLRAGLRNQKLVQDYQAGSKVKYHARSYLRYERMQFVHAARTRCISEQAANGGNARTVG